MAYTLWAANTAISLGTVVAAASQVLPTGLVLIATGAEWGANDRDFPTGMNFGDGRKNTDLEGDISF